MPMFACAKLGTCNIGSVYVQEKILFEECAGGFKAAHVLPRIIRDVHANFELNRPDRLAANL